jgi:tripartite-type tricarboxylate transporter receptor subunit TctC
MPRNGGRILLFGLFFLVLHLCWVVIPGGAPSALAQSYPAKGIQLIVPFPPGGSTDLTGRVVANFLTKKWGRTISVVNKPGAGGTTGVMFALRAKNDGYTILMTVISAGTLNPAIESKLPYKWDEPTYIARTNISPLVFVVKADSPWNNLREVMEAVKKDPTKFKYGTSGLGGPSTFSIAQLLEAAGVDPNQVARVVLQGGAPTVTAVAGGHVDFASQNLSEVINLVEAKRVKGLAVTTPQRVKQLPDIPTSREAGFEGFNLVGWNGIAGPANLPDYAIKKWDEGIREAIKNPGFIAEMENVGAPPSYLGPKDFKAALEKEYKSALQFAEKLGLRR